MFTEEQIEKFLQNKMPHTKSDVSKPCLCELIAEYLKVEPPISTPFTDDRKERHAYWCKMNVFSDDLRELEKQVIMGDVPDFLKPILNDFEIELNDEDKPDIKYPRPIIISNIIREYLERKE